jgi:hypothetical protein
LFSYFFMAQENNAQRPDLLHVPADGLAIDNGITCGGAAKI